MQVTSDEPECGGEWRDVSDNSSCPTFQLPPQCVQHPFQFSPELPGSRRRCRGTISEFHGDYDLSFKLRDRTFSMRQELDELPCGVSRLPLRNVRGYRDRRPPHLGNEPESLIAWTCFCEFVNFLYNVNPLLPNEQVLVPSRLLLSTPWFRLFRHLRLLVTRHLSLFFARHTSLVTCHCSSPTRHCCEMVMVSSIASVGQVCLAGSAGRATIRKCSPLISAV